MRWINIIEIQLISKLIMKKISIFLRSLSLQVILDFHCIFHMDFYNSVNLANNKKNPIVHQKWIDWSKYHTLSHLTLDAVLDHLENGDMMPIVNFLYNLSDELIAQFFATHWIESSDACHH